MRPTRTVVAVLALTSLAAVPTRNLSAQEINKLSLGQYMDMESVSDPQISPDGSQVVYTRGWIDATNDQRKSSLWMIDIEGTKNRHLEDGGGALWSPDGTRILYTASGEPTGSQIFVRWMDAEGAVSQITRLENGPSSPRWSPDGEWIAFTSRVDEDADFAGVQLPRRPDGAKWTDEPKVVERAGYKRDHRHRLDALVRSASRRRYGPATHGRELEPLEPLMEPGRERDLLHLAPVR